MIENILRASWRLLSRFILFCFSLILKPFGKRLTEEQSAALLQFCKFCIVGVSNTLLSYVINVITLFLLEKAGIFQTIDIYIGNTVAFLLSVLWSFYWNNRYVFREDEGSGKKRIWWITLLKTYAAYAFTGVVLSNVISHVCVNIWGINKYIVPLINIVISVPINYVINKFWAYGEKRKKAPEGTPDESGGDKRGRIELKLIIFAGLCLLSAALFVTAMCMGGEWGDLQNRVYFRYGQNHAADLYNVMVYSQDGDPYHNEWHGAWEKAYLPLSYVICGFLAKLTGGTCSFPDKTNMMVVVGGVFISFMVAAAAVASFAAVKGSYLRKTFITALFLTSGPFLFSIERGNLIFFSLLGMIVFLATYRSESRVSRHIGYFMLAVAAAFKGYPALLGVLLLYRKEWKNAAVLAIYGLAVAFIPFLFLKGGFSNIPVWLENVSLNTEFYEFSPGNRVGFRFFINNTPGMEHIDTISLRNWCNRVLFLLTAAGLTGSVFVKKEWTRCLMLVLLMLLFPANSAYYALIYMIPVIIFMLNDEDDGIFMAFMAGLAAVSMMLFRIPGDSFFSDTTVTDLVVNVAVCVMFAACVIYCSVSGLRWARGRMQ